MGTLVIDTGTSSVVDALEIWNDHFIWSVVQSAVAHQVLKGQTSGNPLQIGQSGDITEILGKLTVDGTSILTGAAISLPYASKDCLSSRHWNKPCAVILFSQLSSLRRQLR